MIRTSRALGPVLSLGLLFTGLTATPALADSPASDISAVSTAYSPYRYFDGPGDGVDFLWDYGWGSRRSVSWTDATPGAANSYRVTFRDPRTDEVVSSTSCLEVTCESVGDGTFKVYVRNWPASGDWTLQVTQVADSATVVDASADTPFTRTSDWRLTDTSLNGASTVFPAGTALPVRHAAWNPPAGTQVWSFAVVRRDTETRVIRTATLGTSLPSSITFPADVVGWDFLVVLAAFSPDGDAWGSEFTGTVAPVPTPAPTDRPTTRPSAGPKKPSAAWKPTSFGKKSGRAKVGAKVRVKGTKLSLAGKKAGAKVTYRWLRDGKSIPKATKSAYTLRKADRRHKVSVRVSVTVKGHSPFTKVIRFGKVK